VVSVWTALGVAAALLAAERAVYVWIAWAPASFGRWCARDLGGRLGEPVTMVQWLFLAFKVLQAGVFVGWCVERGGTCFGPPPFVVLVGGAVLLVVGQALNGLVLYRLGRVGVFFGDRFGHDVPWCRAFPFSVLAHPQYVGAVLSIWGLFLIARFPEGDWFLVPMPETVLYVAGARLEGRVIEPSRAGHRAATGKD
jgi:methylene-fatty-acyl-phospholipid synthase